MTTQQSGGWMEPSPSSSSSPTTKGGKSYAEWVQTIAASKPSNKAKMLDLINGYGLAISIQGRTKYDLWRRKQEAILGTVGSGASQRSDIPIPHDPKIPALYRGMRDFAQQLQLHDLDQAVLKSAAWYYHNVEKPTSSQPVATEKYGMSKDNPVVKKEEDKKKYLQYGILGGSMLVGTLLLYFAFRPK